MAADLIFNYELINGSKILYEKVNINFQLNLFQNELKPTEGDTLTGVV